MKLLKPALVLGALVAATTIVPSVAADVDADGVTIENVRDLSSVRAGGKRGKKSMIVPKKDKPVKTNNKVPQKTASGEINPASKRFIRQVRVTLVGLDGDGPLTDAEVLFLEETLMTSWNEIAAVEDPTDPKTARAVLVVQQETDPAYYHPALFDDGSNNSGVGGGGGKKKSSLRGVGGGTRHLASKRLGKYYDENAIIEYGCTYCSDDNEPNRTRPPTPAPTPKPPSVCMYCQDDDVTVWRTPSPSAAPSGSPSMPPSVNLKEALQQVDMNLETNFCASLRTGKFSRFRTLGSCKLF
jgi:hypothetical protein